MKNSYRLMQLFFRLGCIFLSIAILASCTTKYKRGDFTIIVEKEKYESLGGAIKTNSYDILYKGKEIDWSSKIPGVEKPEVWSFHDIEMDPSVLLVEVQSDYYLLKPAGDVAAIYHLGEATYRSGAFERQPYTELLNKGLFFHQAGRIVNLKNFQEHVLPAPPAGRFLAANNEASVIVYLDGVFADDTDLQKTLRNNQNYLNGDPYQYLPETDNGTLHIVEWDVAKEKTQAYNYADTACWNAMNSYYDRNTYPVVTTAFDSSFVFSLFKWVKDSAGNQHLIPKKIRLEDVIYEDDKQDVSPANQ